MPPAGLKGESGDSPRMSLDRRRVVSTDIEAPRRVLRPVGEEPVEVPPSPSVTISTLGRAPPSRLLRGETRMLGLAPVSFALSSPVASASAEADIESSGVFPLYFGGSS